MSKASERLEGAMVDHITDTAWERIKEVAGSEGEAQDIIKLSFHSTGATGGITKAIANTLGHGEAITEAIGDKQMFDEFDVQQMVAQLQSLGINISYSNNLDTRLQKEGESKVTLGFLEFAQRQQNDDYSLRIGFTPEQARQMMVVHTKAKAAKAKEIEATLLQLQPDEIEMMSGGLSGLEEFISPDSNAALKDSIMRGMLDELALALHKRELIQTPPRQFNAEQLTDGLRNQISPDTKQKITDAVSALLDDVLLGQNTEHSEAAAVHKVIDLANAELALKAQQKRGEGRA